MSSDPLQPENESSHAPEYYYGFYCAEKRRAVVNPEQSFSFGQTLFTGVLSAAPIVFLAWLFFRGKSFLSGGPSKGLFASKKWQQMTEEATKMMEKMMDPMGNRDFRINVKDTKFKDVIGIPEAVQEVQQYVQFLHKPAAFMRLGARLPRGCLLTGPPGTGKTLLAKAVAGEADVPFFSCSGADFIEVYAGSGPKRVRELFQAAKKAAPSVVFIDEIDAVGSRGGQKHSSSEGEENRTINQLLAEMDGIEPNDAVVVLAATNFAESIDKALLREGRFDRKVDIPMPDCAARVELFQHYLGRVVTKAEDAPDPSKGVKPAEAATASSAPSSIPVEIAVTNNVAWAQRLAELTPGVAPARIATIVNEAALAAAVGGDRAVTLDRLVPAIDDVVVGKKQRSRMTESALRRLALHEAGHTLVAWMLPLQRSVTKVSIIPRGSTYGHTQQLGKESLDPTTDKLLFTDLCVKLGGREAEQTVYAELTSGAQDDLQQATRAAINQFLAFGMSQQVGLLSYDYRRLEEGRMYQLCSEATQAAAERHARALIDVAAAHVRSVLTTHSAALQKLATELHDRRELLMERIQELLGERPLMHRFPKAVEDAIAGFLEDAQAQARISPVVKDK